MPIIDGLRPAACVRDATKCELCRDPDTSHIAPQLYAMCECRHLM
jgi:hypothetical protein